MVLLGIAIQFEDHFRGVTKRQCRKMDFVVQETTTKHWHVRGTIIRDFLLKTSQYIVAAFAL